MTYCILDVETTGLDPEVYSIFELSGVIIQDGKREEFSFKCKPYTDAQMTEIASEKTGKTQSELETYPDQKEMYNSFITLLDKYGIGKTYNDKAYFVGYNSTSFDWLFLRKWFEFNGNTQWGYRFWYPTLCVMHMAAFYLVGKRQAVRNFQLTTVYKYIFGEDFEGAHGSLADVLATEKLFNFLSNKFLAPLMEKKAK